MRVKEFLMERNKIDFTETNRGGWWAVGQGNGPTIGHRVSVVPSGCRSTGVYLAR